MAKFRTNFSNMKTYNGVRPGPNEMIIPKILFADLAYTLSKQVPDYYHTILKIRGRDVPVIYVVIEKKVEEKQYSLFSEDISLYFTKGNGKDKLYKNEPETYDLDIFLGNNEEDEISASDESNNENGSSEENESESTIRISYSTVSLDKPIINEDGEECTRDIEDKSADGNSVWRANATEEEIVKTLKASKDKDLQRIHEFTMYGLKQKEMRRELNCDKSKISRKCKKYKSIVKEVYKR